MSHKAPSEGQKVTMGKDAPVRQENAGTVAAGSLAAQSSTFQSANKGAAPEYVATNSEEFLRGHSEQQQHSSNGRSNGSNYQQGAPAPTYVNNQYIRDPNGPHGKNLEEAAFRDDTENKSFTADIGADDDPGRAALNKMSAMNETGGPGRGTKQFEVTKDNDYGALSAETTA